MSYKYADLFLQDSVKKELNIVFDNGTITNAELHSNQFELNESICSENELRFGCCEASSVKFKVSNVFESLNGKKLDISMVLNGHSDEPFKFGKYKVVSDTPTADRNFRDIVAYDKMYDIINSDVAEWYNGLTFPLTMKSFRNSFMSYLGIEEVETTLANDKMVIEKTIETFELSGKDVIRSICELNGCFGHINRENKFEYIFLSSVTEIYPDNDLYPSNELYPSGSNDVTNISKSHYISCQYEDFKTQYIDAIEIRSEEDSAGTIVGDSKGNVYIISGNFLIYGKTTDELTEIAEKILPFIEIVQYRPASVSAIGNPTISVGDGIRLNTKYEIINTYVLQRKITGIQALRDSYISNGIEIYSGNVNSVRNDIKKLKSKTNILDRTVDKTLSKIESIETETKKYTDNKLKSYSTTTEMNSAIEQKANEINLSVSEQIVETKEYADGIAGSAESNANASTDNKLKSYSTTTEMNSAIELESSSIKLEVSKTYQTKNDANATKEELNSSIEQNAENITSEVSRAKNAEVELSTRVTQNANGITSKVSKGSVSSEISQEAEQVAIKGNRLVVESENFELDKNGNVHISGWLDVEEGINLSAPYVNSETDSTQVMFDAFGFAINILDSTQTRFSPYLFINNPFSQWAFLIEKDHILSYLPIICNKGLKTSSLQVTGTKSRITNTENYGERLLYCYETPSPMFGDIGEGQLDETGKCYIHIDDIFGETIDLECTYQVFLQPYGKGECYVAERTPSYFVVEGNENLKFGWEIKAIQKSYDTMRLDEYKEESYADVTGETSNYLSNVVNESNENVTTDTYNYLTELLYRPESEVI